LEFRATWAATTWTNRSRPAAVPSNSDIYRTNILTSNEAMSQLTPTSQASYVGGPSTRRSSEASAGRASDAREILKSIRRVIRAIDLRSRKVAQSTGLTIPQTVLLQGIAELGEVTTGTLSAYADISPATVTLILDNLATRGLVERYRSATDRRIVHTRLTGKGREVMSVAPMLLDDRFVARLGSLPEARRVALIDALAEIARMLETTREDDQA
jgi:DNA-binding MarR family transcriptional regulator